VNDALRPSTRAATALVLPVQIPSGSEIATTRVTEIGRLLDDTCTLLGYAARRSSPSSGSAVAVARRAVSTAAPEPADGSRPQPALVALLDSGSVDVELLTRSPAEIAGDQVLLARLYAAVAVLSELVAPATAMSIHLTSALTRTPLSGMAGAPAQALARRLIRWLSISGVLGLGVFIGVIMLLIHVDSGRRSLQQLQELQSDYQSALVDLAGFSELLQTGDRGLMHCPAPPAPAVGAAPATELSRYREPCRRLEHILVQIGVVRRELGHWNAVSQWLANSSPLNWIAPLTGDASPGVSAEDWQTSELRSAFLMAGLTGVILPTLLGLLGACTYVYRSFDRAMRSCTLHGSEGMHGVLRMLLGAILGGLLGLIWTGGQGVRLEGVTLSLGAVAFVVGFSVEIVFRTLDTMVASVARRLAKSSRNTAPGGVTTS
jgi:hypothetical protein